MRFFGERVIETKLSLTELIHRLNSSLRLLISHVRKHAAIVDPIQRADVEREIQQEIERFQIHNGKFRKAFLDRVGRNNLYVSKLISNMELRSLLARYPDPEQVLEDFGAKSGKNLKRLMDDESEERNKSHYLRRFARDLRIRLNSNIKVAVKTVGQKITTVQKQLAAESKKQQELIKKQRQKQTISGKKQQFVPRFGN